MTASALEIATIAPAAGMSAARTPPKTKIMMATDKGMPTPSDKTRSDRNWRRAVCSISRMLVVWTSAPGATRSIWGLTSRSARLTASISACPAFETFPFPSSTSKVTTTAAFVPELLTRLSAASDSSACRGENGAATLVTPFIRAMASSLSSRALARASTRGSDTAAAARARSPAAWAFAPASAACAPSSWARCAAASRWAGGVAGLRASA